MAPISFFDLGTSSSSMSLRSNFASLDELLGSEHFLTTSAKVGPRHLKSVALTEDEGDEIAAEEREIHWSLEMRIGSPKLPLQCLYHYQSAPQH